MWCASRRPPPEDSGSPPSRPARRPRGPPPPPLAQSSIRRSPVVHSPRNVIAPETSSPSRRSTSACWARRRRSHGSHARSQSCRQARRVGTSIWVSHTLSSVSCCAHSNATHLHLPCGTLSVRVTQVLCSSEAWRGAPSHGVAGLPARSREASHISDCRRLQVPSRAGPVGAICGGSGGSVCRCRVASQLTSTKFGRV